MAYLLLKALHLAAAVTWIGGMLGVAIVLARVRPQHGQATVPSLDRLRAWDRRVTTPAMLLAWMLGMVLASVGHWFPQGWLMAKLACVLLLSGLHGKLAGRLRGRSPTPAGPPGPGGVGIAAGIVIATALIIVLVVVKPHAW